MSNQRPTLDVDENVAREGQDAVDRFVQELQGGWDRHDAEISNRHFAQNVVWGSPFGETVHGYEPLYAIHTRLKTQGVGGPSSRFELVRVIVRAFEIARKRLFFESFMFTVYSAEFVVRTEGKGTYEVTDKVAELVRASQVQTGLVNVFLRHTSASLLIFENADLSARRDLEKFFERLVPEGEGYFSHSIEGPDDMPSHIRMALTRTSESIPVAAGQLRLGTWQGLFLYEHRALSADRSIAVSVIGTTK